MKLLIFLLLAQPFAYGQAERTSHPLRIGIAGLTHGHVHWILRAVAQGDVQLAGIAEPDRELARRLTTQYGISGDLVYTHLDDMLARTNPEAVAAFGSIYEHLAVVKACAPKGIHVMVEKPLAVNLDHARQMEALARKHNIHLLTNYETTWYESHHLAYRMLHVDDRFGSIIKIVVHDGHQGPQEIGVNAEFLKWLTDPVQNGGGAIMDFGCYGANLITWLMKGERPLSVSAITQQIKPEVYPDVDDEATIVVTYPRAQGIIQASWNWPYSRKDIEVYAKTGWVTADKESIRYGSGAASGQSEKTGTAPEPLNDPFLFLASVVRGSITLNENDLSGLPVNMVAMEILDAAKRSAASGKVVYLQPR